MVGLVAGRGLERDEPAIEPVNEFEAIPGRRREVVDLELSPQPSNRCDGLGCLSREDNDERSVVEALGCCC